ncbi:MAG: hypothetical protein IJZ85_03650 [Lachnospiraceae bacterium]|nr:hypothetical protein [Lachnospiraceae bacterium]
MNNLKTLKDLTLLDRFLFDETMDRPEAHAAALQIILGDEQIQLLTPAQTEKELRTAPWLRAIRLDVYALDQEGTVYNTEMQAEHRTPFDLFGKQKYQYTFIPCCKENKDIELSDGAMRIFLNTKGTNDHEVSRELRDFLHYMECTDENLVHSSDSERLKKIHACVSQIKASEEMGVKYMQKLEEKIRMQQQAQATGLAQGMAQGMAQGLTQGRTEATSAAIQALMQNMNISIEKALTLLNIPKEDWDNYR